MKKIISLICASFLILVNPLMAEEGPSDGFTLTLYGIGDNTAAMTIGSSETGKTFSFELSGSNAENYRELGFYAVNSRAEVKITQVQCDGSSCSGSMELSDIQRVGRQFDFDQAFNVTLRKGNADVYIGQMTTNSDRHTNYDDTQKIYCTYNANGDNGTECAGKFEPKGYDGDQSLFIKCKGFPIGKTFGVYGENAKGQKLLLFSFETHDACNETDAEIYGKDADDERITEEPDQYSYNYHCTDGEESDRASSKAASSNDLALSNLGMGQTEAAKQIKEDNKARKKGKRNKKNKSQAIHSAGNDHAPVADYLGFDPLGQSLKVLDSKGELYGTITCSPDGEGGGGEGEEHKGVELSSPGDDDTVRGMAFIEMSDPHGTVVGVRVKGLDAGSYLVCLNNIAVNKSLTVASHEDNTFGEIRFTDSAELVSKIPELGLYSGTLLDATTITVVHGDSCAGGTIILQGSVES